MDVIELYRGMAWVIRRRDQILGTLSQVDTAARTLRSQLNEVRAAIPGTMPATFGGILYGISSTGEGDFARSNSVLQPLLQINGFDHPLTPITLLQIGYNQYLLGEYRAAKATLLEASYSAGIFNQFDVFRESLVFAARAHIAVNRDQALPELDLAFDWARTRGLRVAQVRFAMVAAENAIENGQMPLAAQQLSTARGLMRTNDIKRSELALRLAVLEQTVAAINGTTTDLQSLRNALTTYRGATPWAFQIEMLLNPARRRNLTTTTLAVLIERVLRDPTQADWDRDPFECLAYLTGDRSQFLLDAMSIQLNKGDFTAALQASENLRRVQFYANLPLGGRMMAFRELLARSPAELTPELRRKQAEMLGRFTTFQKLLEQAEALLSQLRRQPVEPEGDAKRAWEQQMEQLSVLGQQIEQQLVQVSVRREAIPLLFPPPVDIDRIQKAIPPRTLCLVVIARENVHHVFLVTDSIIKPQSSLSQVNVSRAIRGLAKSWGHTSASAVLQPQLLKDQSWKKASYQLLQAMIPDVKAEFWDSFDELVVVPSGLFWYLPFETLAVSDDPASELLTDKLAIRYAPSLNLAFGEQLPKRLNRIAFYPGKIDQRDDEALVNERREAFDGVLPQAIPIQSSRFTPDSIGPVVNGIIYWNEIKQAIWPAPWTVPDSKRESYLQLNLERWVQYPNIGPELLIVAGGNSAMADGLRGTPDGRELEFYSTLLMAAGCQSIVLPRWRCGGHLAYDLQIELVKHVKDQPTAVAMQKAIAAIRQTPVDLKRQTRIRSGRDEGPATADHPFLWAGQMVIDRGRWYREPDDGGLPVTDEGQNPLQLGGQPPEVLNPPKQDEQEKQLETAEQAEAAEKKEGQEGENKGEIGGGLGS